MHGHDRAITYLKYSPDGDVFFSASRDENITMWRADSGERIGVFHGHEGAVYQLDVTSDTKYLFSASSDWTCRIWEVNTGREMAVIRLGAPVLSVAVSNGDTHLCLTTRSFSGKGPVLYIYDLSCGVENIKDPEMVIEGVCVVNTNINALVWTSLNKEIIAACSDGNLRVVNPTTGKVDRVLHVHDGEITSLILSYDRTMLATSSKDAKAKVFDAHTLEEILSFATDRPLNSVALSPIRDHLVTVGGVEARDVTTSHSEKMESLFYNLATREEIGRVKGSFGTMNSVEFNPDGKSFITGGEDGYVRLCFFDPDYFTMDEENEKNLREVDELSRR